MATVAVEEVYTGEELPEANGKTKDISFFCVWFVLEHFWRHVLASRK